jgi:hypothetical protein
MSVRLVFLSESTRLPPDRLPWNVKLETCIKPNRENQNLSQNPKRISGTLYEDISTFISLTATRQYKWKPLLHFHGNTPQFYIVNSSLWLINTKAKHCCLYRQGFQYFCVLSLTHALQTLYGNNGQAYAPQRFIIRTTLSILLLLFSTQYLLCVVAQWRINPRIQVVASTNFLTLVTRICGASVWNFLHVTILAPRISRWLPDFWKICAPLF